MSHGTDHLEQRLRVDAGGFPGTAAHPADLDGVIARGRRARTLGIAARLGVAATLLAGTAVAAPALLDRTPAPAPVVTGVDETVQRDKVATGAPMIEVTSPRDGTVVNDSSVTFSGKVAIGADVSVGPFDVEVAPDGRWRITLDLDEGKNRLTFWATDRAGRRAPASVTVIVTMANAVPPLEEDLVEDVDEAPAPAPEAEPAPRTAPVAAQPAPAPKPQPKPAPAKAEAHAFTSHQQYGSCSEAVPYDEFWGTAAPGTEVWVWSEYGEKTVRAAESGEWWARVEFPTAPQGKAFAVKTKSLATGEKIHWEFVNTGEGGAHEEPATWSAWQHDAHVEHDPPYNYYEGTAPAGTVIEVGSPYGTARTSADGAGHWKTKVWFETAPYGTNTWAVVVESSNGDRAAFEFTGTRPEPQPEPKPEQPTEVAWTSDQVYDVTDDTPPRSLYAGTATPGHKIVIFSAYGEGSVHVDESGQWSLWVEFPNAPRGQGIQVKVKHWETGEIHTYELQVA